VSGPEDRQKSFLQKGPKNLFFVKSAIARAKVFCFFFSKKKALPTPEVRTGALVPDTEDMLTSAAAWLHEEGAVAMATVVKTWGSSPRQPGSQLLVAPSGRMAGSVSGGCIEVAVAEASAEVLRSGEAQLMSFGVTDERAWELGLACGGRLQVFIERIAATS
jgi:hypothetical protein